MDPGDLDARLLGAHAAGDGAALAGLYAEAAAMTSGDPAASSWSRPMSSRSTPGWPRPPTTTPG